MEVTRNWRLRQQRYGLVGEICPDGHKVFPPRDLCPDCNQKAKAPFTFSGKGEVYSYTTVYNAPGGFEEQTPYTIALIRLVEGPLITAMMTDVDNDQVEIGQPVEMVTRRLRSEGDKGVIVYGYKFRPKVA